VSDSEKTMNAYKTELEGAEKRLCEIADEKQTAANRLAGTERLSEGKRKRLDEARKAFEDAQRALGEKQQRHKVLSDIEKSREGYSRAVKEVIGASEQGRLAGIHGTVADVVSVPKKYVTAIETALGSVMQNIIVDNEETATRCIRFLKETNSGRATFYPLTSMKGRTLNEPRLVSEEGFEGIASELVSFDGEYANIINYLLGLTAVVDDIDAATVIGKKYGYKFRIVTLDGQVVNSGGSFTGGSRISGSGIISRKQELDALLSDIEKLRDTVKTRSEEFERYRAEYAKFSIEAEGMQDKIRSLEQDEIRGTAEKSRLTGLIEQLVSQSATARQTLNRFEAQIAQQRDIIANAEKEIGVLDGEIAELEKKHAEQTGERTKAENKLKAISDGINALNLEKMAAQKDADALSAQIKSINDDRRTLLENSGGYKSAMEALDNSDREIREKIVRLNLEIEKSSASLTEQNDEIESVSGSITELDGKITELRRDIDEANKNKQKFSSELARLEERRGTLQKEYDKIVSLLMDSYEMTVSQAEREAKIPENLLVAENDLAELNKRISSLGIVNMASIEEYETVSKRYEFQSAQLRDIENAKHGLEKLIEQLTGDIKTRFLASFEDINKHFKEIFVQIFGAGSHAELELTNPEDLLNSGIEIKAAPPGKVIKNLISLSGGEQTMVAITIYFAILMHRPTPFCMLDEVDAALDDINVEKYIRYLNQFSKSTQLMVITHRRGTIEGCSVLYGVFMQEKGVSRLLRQELSEELSDELNDIID
ncbi:MAG TPA: chromosome segregation protein SMC, partial [Ruminococcaceae bacterium]|nr:chromosome segregation protein SMC [Oscillospiraceae bacterium]